MPDSRNTPLPATPALATLLQRALEHISAVQYPLMSEQGRTPKEYALLGEAILLIQQAAAALRHVALASRFHAAAVLPNDGQRERALLLKRVNREMRRRVTSALSVIDAVYSERGVPRSVLQKLNAARNDLAAATQGDAGAAASEEDDLANGCNTGDCPHTDVRDCTPTNPAVLAQNAAQLATPHGVTPERAAPPEYITRIINGLDAAANRFHDLGDQAERDRRFIAALYDAWKHTPGGDFTRASRQARQEFVARVLAEAGVLAPAAAMPTTGTPARDEAAATPRDIEGLTRWLTVIADGLSYDAEGIAAARHCDVAEIRQDEQVVRRAARLLAERDTPQARMAEAWQRERDRVRQAVLGFLADASAPGAALADVHARWEPILLRALPSDGQTVAMTSAPAAVLRAGTPSAEDRRLLAAILDAPFTFDLLNDCTLSPEQKVTKARELLDYAKGEIGRLTGVLADAQRTARYESDVAAQAVAAKDAAESQLATLREEATACANELEAELKTRYGWPAVHPSQQGRFDLDMASVVALRATLAAAALDEVAESATMPMTPQREAMLDRVHCATTVGAGAAATPHGDPAERARLATWLRYLAAESFEDATHQADLRRVAVLLTAPATPPAPEGATPEGASLLPDYPDLDATDGAHPAWWRGCDHGVETTCRVLTRILDGDPGPHHFGSPTLTALAARLDRGRPTTDHPTPAAVATLLRREAQAALFATRQLSGDAAQEEVARTALFRAAATAVDSLDAAIQEAATAIEALFGPAHVAGCLTLTDRRMPCQCGARDREATAIARARTAARRLRSLAPAAPAPHTSNG